MLCLEQRYTVNLEYICLKTMADAVRKCMDDEGMFAALSSFGLLGLIFILTRI
jgi:hypothetical protein